MNLELIFSVASALAMLGWLLLLLSPWLPVWSDRIAGLAIPLVLSLGYVLVAVVFSGGGDGDGGGGGFGSLAEVTALFSQQESVLAGWVHYLAFDLFVGAWICRVARREGIKFWFVVPCLPLTLMLGPAGYLAFGVVRLFGRQKTDSPT